MRCKRHPGDLSSTIGVCATCLREKLLPILADQSPPLIFPRSVSPPLDPESNKDTPNRLFFRTPQLGSTGLIKPVEPRENGRFSLLRGTLFRSRSEQYATSSSSSWLSGLFSRRRGKQPRPSSFGDSTAGGGQRGFSSRGRGMSPVRVSDCGGNGEVEYGGSSGYSSRQTPLRSVRGGGGRRGLGSRNGDGISFCLSPLVWPSPSPRRSWNQKAPAAEVAVPAVKPQLATAASFCANRSRKIADFGRFHSRH